jgi:MFS family permease
VAVAQRLALGRLISLTGGAAAYVALIAAIYGETGSAAWLSAALFAGVVGSVIAAPFAGWIGDHFDRRGVLIASDLAAAAVAIAMALTGQAEALVVLLGLAAVAQSLFEPASAAAMPNLVAPEDVPRANARRDNRLRGVLARPAPRRRRPRPRRLSLHPVRRRCADLPRLRRNRRFDSATLSGAARLQSTPVCWPASA